jgi:hypothetical protein
MKPFSFKTVLLGLYFSIKTHCTFNFYIKY